MRSLRSSRLAVLLAWALLVTSIDLTLLLRGDGDASRPPAAAPPVAGAPAQDSSVVAPPSAPPPPTSNPGAAAVTASPMATFSGGGSVDGRESGGDGTVSTPRSPAGPAPAPASVSCSSELPLAQSPDAPFNFMCTSDGAPITWRGGHLTLFASGLSVDQRAALPVALAEFERVAGFTVTQVDSPDADVVMTRGGLAGDEGGHTSVHYTCDGTCAFDHADVVLAAQRTLSQGVWVTTLLHELGHVAGLNHVSRQSQVMYPELSVGSPLTYGAGDSEGLHELADHRSQ